MLLILNVIVILSITNINCRGDKVEDKVIMSPVELIDQVRTELFNSRGFTAQGTPYQIKVPNQENENDVPVDETDECEDEKTLKQRKIWSRWSKWGDCSVTCGGGTTSRHRFCVAGRCARGEREEQHRPCLRAPCLLPFSNFTNLDELHESE